MRTIPSKEYATRVEDRIENKVEGALAEIFVDLMNEYQCVPGWVKQGPKFHDAYMEGIASEIRDLAIQLFEECGFDVRSDGTEF